MPTQIVRFAFVINLGSVLLLFLIGLVKSSPPTDEYVPLLPLFQYRRYVGTTSPNMQEPIYLDVGAVQLGDNIDVDGPKSSEVGTLQPLQMVRCLGLHEQFKIASTKDIKMGRSYRRLLVGTSVQEELELLLLKCQYPHSYDDDDATEESNTITFYNIYSTSTTSSSVRVIGVPAFLVSHPNFFLHLALAFLVLAFLASLLYFSMD